MTEYLERPDLTASEELVVATHEAGHAICALHCEHSPPIERISIRGDLAGALGFVAYAGIKLLAGRARDVGVAVWVIAAVFVAKFVWLT